MSERPVFGKTEKVLLWTFLIFSWVILWLKAGLSPITHDEAATFFYYVQGKSFIPFFADADPNNHVLNSALTSVFYSLFGDSLISLRLASLLFFPLYFYFVIKIAGKIKNTFVKWVFILVFVFSNGLVDFFSLCRGYGMSMALLMGSIYYLIQALQTNKTKYQPAFLSLALLAFLANMTLLVSFLMIFIFFVYLQIKDISNGNKKNILILPASVFLIAILLLPLIKYLFMLQNTGGLYYGSHGGFWTFSVPSVLYMLTGISSSIVPYVVLMLFLLMIIFFVIQLRNKLLPLSSSPELIFFTLLSGSIAGVCFMGSVMNVNYPEDRTGLYFFPYFIGNLCFLTDKIVSLRKNFYVLIILIPLLFFPADFVISGSFSKHGIVYPQKYIYTGDRVPEKFITEVIAKHKPGDFPATIGGNSIRMFSWAYYNYRNDGSQSVLQFVNYPSTDEDYQIVKTNEIHGWRAYYDSINYDASLKVLLLKKKKAYTRVLLKTIHISSGNISDEIYNMGEFLADSLTGKTLYLGYRLAFSSDASPFNAKIGIDVIGNKEEKKSEQFIGLNWMKLKYSGNDINFTNGLLIHKISPGVKTIKTFIRNNNNIMYQFAGDLYLYEMKS